MPLGLGEGSYFGGPKTFGGQVKVPDGIAATPGLRVTSWNHGLIGISSSFFGLVVNSTLTLGFSTSSIDMGPNVALRWAPGAIIQTPDVTIVRDGAAGTLALKNLTNAMIFRIYNTFTDASNYERAGLNWAANVFTIAPEAAGTGTLRGMVLGSATGSLAFFGGTPTTKPTAYTQTYATADKTHADFTSADIGAFTGGVTGFLDAAERDNIRTQFNALRADVADLKQLANSVIDDLQALALVG